MKKILLRSISLIITLISVVMSCIGCFDTDEFIIDLGFYNDKKGVNEKVDVLFRECHGVTCLDETKQKSVTKGSNLRFWVDIDDEYVYLGNSVGAKYDKNTKFLVIESVKAPMTVDMYVESKRNLYYVNIGTNKEDVQVNLTQGELWSQEPHSITLEAVLNDYEIICWSLGSRYVVGQPNLNAKVIGIGSTLTYDVSKKGIHNIYLNVVPADEYNPMDVPSLDEL